MWLGACAALAALAAARAVENVTVVRMPVSLEELHTITVDANTEFILDFIPNAEQSRWPTRLWVSSSGGDIARPLLLTIRQKAGASTWQLPQQVQGRLLFQVERTLCPDDSVLSNSTECVSEEELRAPGWFSLHAVSACARALHVQLRATPARDWRLAFQQPQDTLVTPEAPRVHYYAFDEEQEQVRLVVSSDDDVCATVAVQDYTCPITETLDELALSTLRMTVQRSGAVQLSRSRFPRGFYVVVVVHQSDEACAGEQPEQEDWLWEAAVYGAEHTHHETTRTKLITLDTRPALTRAQYAVAAGASLAVFACVYAAFGLLVLAQRWPRFGRLVAPRAVLRDPPRTEETAVESQIDASQLTTGTPARRKRRSSDATFDSSDNSDSDESDEESAPSPASAASSARNGGPPAADAADSPDGDVGSPTNGNSDPPTVFVIPSGGVSNRGFAPSTPLDGPPAPEPPVPLDVANGQPAPAAGEEQQAARPFGLPARLRVAALARRRERVLRARSDRYLTTLATVAVFYALPVIQFVVAFQIVMNLSGSLDLCYYNFLCAHPAGQLADFNHVLSNAGYLLLGALFLLQLRRRQSLRARLPRHEEYGIPAHYGLLAALGAGMMVVALLSASYHVCPNRLNFQFDTAFMYVLAVLSMVKIYQSRHPDVNARAHATFGVLAVLIAIVVWGVLGGGALFWGVFTVLHVFTFLLLSLRIYYLGQFRLEKETLSRAARGLRALPARGLRPLYSARLVMLVIANAVNWAFAIYGLFMQSTDFASHLLSVLLCNTLVYMGFYLCMKLLHGERPRWYAWGFLGGAAAAWAPALYFFLSGSSDWAATPAQSRHSNHECLVLQFYDSHDLWHMLSAGALYLSFNAMLTWDDGLAAVPRTEIAVF
ncbi:SID1 transmembrane family member 1-like [Ostrinia nubilalis]|uniref:SID1 transmembrane family member 1-like n=1 Tax=Ostrinia nubilalis TaxID=29057 RepID=UPI003082677C